MVIFAVEYMHLQSLLPGLLGRQGPGMTRQSGGIFGFMCVRHKPQATRSNIDEVNSL
jgi:hypothetical protein